MKKSILRRVLSPLLTVLILAAAAGWVADGHAAPTDANEMLKLRSAPIIRKIRNSSEQMQMTVNTSRILTLDQKIPQVQVNNPDILEVTPLSPTEIQVSAKATGVTQVNLWGEDKKVYTINVIVFGDAQELEMVLRTQFPNAALRVIPVVSGVLISGFVDKPAHVCVIIRIAEEYYPKVINNITIAGVQQVLLHVKVMEVSRTKLRRLGFDFAKFTGNDFVLSTISGLITAAAGGAVATSGTETIAFGVVDGSNTFFGVLEALRQDNLVKILAEPNIVAVSGRPSKFHVGGSFRIVPQGLAAGQPEKIEYGTTVDFVAIVLGNGRIRLEVRPTVSELDPTLNVDGVPGLRTRTVDTGVELQAGQTLAIAGLVQMRIEAENRGLPWISDLPYFGAPFRKVEERINEVELIILVTPELVEAMDAAEVPPCGPGTRTTSPTTWELFMKGHIEVPNCCPADGAGPTAAQPMDGMILERREVTEPPSAPEPEPAAGRSNIPHNRHTAARPQRGGKPSPSAEQRTVPNFIGPVGYDVVK